MPHRLGRFASFFILYRAAGIGPKSTPARLRARLLWGRILRAGADLDGFQMREVDVTQLPNLKF